MNKKEGRGLAMELFVIVEYEAFTLFSLREQTPKDG
jgi:hypothetical protein